MSDDANDANEQSEHVVGTVGERLKSEREKASMSLEDVAGKTRITIRHLEALEASQHTKLPGKTYILGFAKAYARALGLDDAEISAQLREELAQSDELTNHNYVETFEPASASRIPSKALAWTIAIIAAIALAAYLIWRTAQMDLSGPDEVVTEEVRDTEAGSEAEQNEDNAQEVITTGKVIMTATDEVWLQISDADGKTIYENVMQDGDSYEIPADANNPVILTGRPDVLKFTVGGKSIKPLGDGKSTIKDVGVSAQALIDFNAAPDSSE